MKRRLLVLAATALTFVAMLAAPLLFPALPAYAQAISSTFPQPYPCGPLCVSATAVTSTVPFAIQHGATPTDPMILLDGTGPYGDFTLRTYDYPNPGDAGRDNRVIYLGYNTASSGLPLIAGEPSIGTSTETYYAPDATSYVEYHVFYNAPTGEPAAESSRPLTFSVNRATGAVAMGFAFDDLYLRRRADDLIYFQISPYNTFLLLQSDAKILKNTNNAGWLKQKNAAGTEVNIAYVNDANLVALGENSANVAGVRAYRRFGYMNNDITIASNGVGTPAAYTLEPTQSFAQLHCNDTDGCNITMSETGAFTGQVVIIKNQGANVCNFSDTADVSELAGAFAMGLHDSLTLVYDGYNAWTETARSDN